MRWTILLLCSLLVLAACGSQGNDQAEQPATTETAEVAADQATEAVAATATIEGQLGCGHCSHQIGTSCSAAVQTAEGTVYILEGIGSDHEAFQKRFDKLNIQVTGVASERDGVHYLQVESFTL